MGQLTYDVKKDGDKAMIAFKGAIDEDCTMPTLDFSGLKELMLEFDGLTLINSCGIRDWVAWVKTFPAGLVTKFTNCPSILVDQINMINGFVPNGGVVDSFYIPYFCDDCDKVVNKTVTKGKDYDGEGFEAEDEMPCPDCGAESELDVIPTKYFKFLKQYG